MKPTLELNEQQLAFIRHREGPAALLAVPGSGKTTTTVCRTAALIRSGVAADRILTMTFTKAAALDMTRRYAQLYGVKIPDGVKMPEDATIPDSRAMRDGMSPSDHLLKSGDLARFSTIHSFALHLIRTYCQKRNRPMPIVLTESGTAGPTPTRLGLLTQLYREHVGGRIGDDALEALSMGISLAKNTMQSPEAAAVSLERGIKGFGVVFEAYEKLKKQHRFVDFDDMLTLCHRILTMDAGILEDTRNRYDFIQVDEAQDSSLIQHAIIDLIAKPRNNLVLIGDEDQSIYVWRGAHPSGLLGFAQRYPEAEIFLMETNYRSRASIVSLADRFIRANTERTVKNLVAGLAQGFSPAGKGKASEMGSESKPPSVQEGKDIRIVRIANLSQQYKHVQAELTGKATGSTAILYRNNRSVYGLADMLDHAGLPFRLRDFKDTLFQHWITRDISAFLRVMQDPADREAFFAVAGRMNAYLSRDQLERLQVLPGEGNLFRLLRKDPGVQVFQRKRLEEVEQRFRRLKGLKPKDAIVGLLDCVSYDNTLAFAARTGGYTEEYLEGIIDTLLVIAQNQETLGGFLERLYSLRVVLDAAKSADRRNSAITLSTVHSAKGLEFDRVLLVDMVEGEFPAADTEDSGSDIEEERRLCYVAITRARYELQVLVPAKWGRQKAEPSRFIREMEKAMQS